MAPITTLKQLSDMLVHIIFTATVQHSAVNFPQLEWYALPPARPMMVSCVWGERQRERETVRETGSERKKEREAVSSLRVPTRFLNSEPLLLLSDFEPG